MVTFQLDLEGEGESDRVWKAISGKGKLRIKGRTVGNSGVCMGNGEDSSLVEIYSA